MSICQDQGVAGPLPEGVAVLRSLLLPPYVVAIFDLTAKMTTGPLAGIAVSATIAIVVGALLTAPLHPVIVNAVFLVSVGTAMLMYSLLMNISMIELPLFLWRIVFNSQSSRYLLLLFWSFNVLASISFGVFVTVRGSSTTIHRKFFHLTSSLIFLSGLFFDRDFIWLSGWLMLCIFVIIETFRFFEVPPWEETLNNFLLVFKDEQDSMLLLTPIYLLLGIWIPLFLSPNDKYVHLFHLAGVASVGVGDSIAAIIGSTYGTTRWPRTRKTVEGSVAMAGSIAVFLIVARFFCSPPYPSYPRILFTSLILAAIEAFTVKIDNIALPIVGYLLLQ
ncbi:unnamed protein product [Cylicocyclus nassatus]|uniref:dolichol kinase n=1 Tax=Cylicocyclus nassatus TaxID=53992 RepID=A0AA36M657_CYLNA|nr:unnamed protein product [Cylicocyclus nassatus]